MGNALVQRIASFSLAAVVTGSVSLAADDAKPASAVDIFEPPVRLKADDKVIDTGEAWGHSSPAVTDLNGDGKPDLVVGDFGGKFRRYLNVGSKSAPVYEVDGFIQAGGEEAKVNIYCCIGSQPRFHDLDGDGTPDMLANSYDPGHAYLFRGKPDHQFAAREELSDRSGVPIRSWPVQKQKYQSFGSFFEAVDWDADGDLDLLIGCFDGQLKLRVNDGTPKDPKFAPENVTVNAGDKELRVKAHLCPVVADWDADGLWDVIAGSDDGSVTWFRNVGKKGAPSFAEGQTLVDKHDGNGYDLLLWDKDKVTPGIRAQPEVIDFNGDGKLDLLVGDFYTAYDLKADLSEGQKKQVDTLINENKAIIKAYADKLQAMRDDFKKRYPGDAVFTDEVDKEWSEAYKALRASPDAKKLEEQEKVFTPKMRPFLASTRTPDDLAKSHGHVWLFLRK